MTAKCTTKPTLALLMTVLWTQLQAAYLGFSSGSELVHQQAKGSQPVLSLLQHLLYVFLQLAL